MSAHQHQLVPNMAKFTGCELPTHATYLVLRCIWPILCFGHAEWMATPNKQVVKCASLSLLISTKHGHSWQNKHTSSWIYRWKLTFQVKAHQTLYTTHWHFQNCCCYLCLCDPDATETILVSLPCTGRSHMHGDSRMAVIIFRSLVYTKIYPPPPVIGTGYQ